MQKERRQRIKWCWSTMYLIFNKCIIIYTPYHSWFFLQKSWMVQKGSSDLSVSIIKIRKWCHWPRVLDTSLWGWNFLFFIIFYLSPFACITGYCSCDLVLYVILNLFLCESNLLVWPSIIDGQTKRFESNYYFHIECFLCHFNFF